MTAEHEDGNLRLMASAPVPKVILTLAVPTVLSTLISLLYNLTDTYFIGLLDDPVQLGAISLAFPVFMVMQAVGNMVGLGAPSYISRCLGAGRYDEVRKISAVSVYVSVGMTLGLTVLLLALMEPILGLIGTSGDTIGPTREYLRIVVIFSVVLVLQVILPALLRAEGRIKQAVTGMIIGTVGNIILDPVMILGLGLGVAGAAWATIIGNVLAVIYYLTVYLRGNTMLSIFPRDFKPSVQIFKEVLKIGLPSSISQMMGSVTLILFNNQAAAYEDNVITAYGVAVKMITMEFMIVHGYVSGYIPFAGYNYGAQNYKRMLSGLRFTMMTGTLICFAFLIPFTILAPAYMGLFSSVDEIIQIGANFLRAQAWAVPFMAVQTSMISTFQATGQGLRALIVNLGRQMLFYVPFLFLFNHLWGLTGLLHVQMASDLATTLAGVLIGAPMLYKLYQEERHAAQLS